MKIFFLSFVSILFFSHHLWSQGQNADLLAQSPDGKNVKLVWFLKTISGDIPGFDIKRRDGLGEWKVLNSHVILPGISLKKSLTHLESDNVENSRIKEKLKDLLKTGKLQEYDYNTFVEKWKNNDKEIQEIVMLAALDFDVSVLSGFGYVDHTATQKMNYHYGLFIHGTNTLLNEVSWNYGEIPDLNVIQEITSKSTHENKGVQVIWNVDEAKTKAAYVAGFNIYKHGIRLNDGPIHQPSGVDATEYSWTDATADPLTEDQYSISTESLFGIEGIIKSYTYNPADHPDEYKKAVVTQIASLGFYFKDGLSLQWTFPKEYEKFIQGFYIYKENMPKGYNRVSELVSKDVRTYMDKTGSTVNGSIRVKVVAVYNDKTQVQGTEKVYSYFPMIDPPRPQNTRATGSIENKRFVARITWDAPMSGDSITRYYKAYIFDPLNGRFSMLADNLPLKNRVFQHPITPGIGATHMFYITSVSKAGVESPPGDTVSVWSPSLEIPAPVIGKSEVVGNKIRVEWQYSDLPDLVGFRVYSNNSMVADENVLSRTAREFVSAELIPGATYSITVKAIAESGVLSNVSSSAEVTLPALKK